MHKTAEFDRPRASRGRSSTSRIGAIAAALALLLTGFAAPAAAAEPVPAGVAPAVTAASRIVATAAAEFSTTVTGRILTPEGTPAAGVTVGANGGGWGEGGYIGQGTTGSDGRFSFVATSPNDSLVVRVVAGGSYVDGVVADDGTLAPSGLDGTVFKLFPAGGAVTTGDLTLTRGTLVSGTFTVAGLTIPAQLSVNLWNYSTYSSFGTTIDLVNGANAWTIAALPGEYSLNAHSGVLSGDSLGQTQITVGTEPVTGISLSAPTLTGATLSGKALDARGAPVAGTMVSLQATAGGFESYRSATTAADGSFALGNLLPGDYRLSTWWNGFQQYWPDATRQLDAELVTITASTGALTGYDLHLLDGVTIAGTVTNIHEGDDPLVSLYNEAGQIERTWWIDAEGDTATYEFGPFAPGTYQVAIERGAGTLVQWYDDAFDADDATTLDATTDGASITGIDFALSDGATISGTVATAEGVPFADATVGLYRASSLSYSVASTTTAADGTYTLPWLAADNYVVKVSGGEPPAATRWYGQADAAGEKTVITLGHEQSFTADITTTPGGGVSGTLYSDDLNASTYVNLESVDGGFSDSEWVFVSSSDSVGWSFTGLEAGEYYLHVGNAYWPGGVAREQAEPITVTAGEVVSGLELDLRGAVSANVSIAATDGSEIGYGSVMVERHAPEEWGDYWNHVDSVNGSRTEFGFRGLEPGEYRATYSGRTTSGDTLRVVRQTFTITEDGAPVEVALQTQLGWKVTGRITDAATGAGIGDASVRASGTDYESLAGVRTHFTTSSGTGAYSLGLGAQGSWEIAIEPSGSTYTASARTVTVADGDLENIDFALVKGAPISGRVTAENNGVGLSDIDVNVYDAAGGYVTNVSTDSAGRYTTPALAPGVYTLEFSNWNGLYIEEWWDGATSRESATPLTVGTGPVTGVNASMRLGGVITGYVHDEDYEPVQGATVGLATPPTSGIEAFFAPLFALFGVSSPLLGVETTTDVNGEFTLPAVDSGDYALYVYTPEHGTIWSGASRTLAGSSPVHVASGERTWEYVQLPRLADGEEPRTPAQSISDDFAIQQDPQDTSVVEGETAIFTAAASGATVPGIQWQIKQPGDADFRDLADETWEELSLQGLTLADTGTQVRAVFTLGGETKTTTAATLTVTPAPTAPDKPAAPTVSAITAGSATVSWTAPADGGSLISGYTVTVRDGSTLVKTYELAPTGTVLVSGLSAATAYTVTVVAHNGIGSSVASDETAFTTAAAAVVPGAPTGVSAVAGDGQATVSWAAPASNGGSALTGFVVTAAPGGATVTAGAGATSAVVPGLTNGTAYTFTVVATNAVGSSAASAASAAVTPVAPAVVPGAPTGVSAVAGDGQATVSWAAPASNGGSALTGFVVTAAPGGATVTAGAGATSAVVPGLTNGTAYTFTVVATNAVGSSVASAASAAVTPVAAAVVPGAPTGVSAVAGDGQATVSWAAPASNGGSPLTGFVVTAAPGGATVTAGAGATSAVVPGLTNGTAYTFTVVATNAVGSSAASAASSAVTPVAPAVPEEPVDPVDPGEPQTRLAGPGRYDTSAAVSAATFAPGVPVVYLATGLKFPDALAGAAAAGTAGGPVLLTAPTSLPPAIAAELERLDPQRIVLLGDANSISETVRTLVRQYTTGSVDRIAGIDRYATSAAIALDTYQGVEGIDVVYLATGLKFPDALAGAAAGGSLGGPVLLTQPDKLPEATRGALQTLKPKRIVLLGDANSVSQAVAGQVAGYASIGVDRKAGIDRYATAAAIAGEFGTDVPVVYLATGLNFPDALSGAAAAGYQNGPVLLTMPDKLPPATAQALADLKPRKVIVLGDQKSVQDSVLAQALQFVVP